MKNVWAFNVQRLRRLWFWSVIFFRHYTYRFIWVLQKLPLFLRRNKMVVIIWRFLGTTFLAASVQAFAWKLHLGVCINQTGGILSKCLNIIRLISLISFYLLISNSVIGFFEYLLFQMVFLTPTAKDLHFTHFIRFISTSVSRRVAHVSTVVILCERPISLNTNTSSLHPCNMEGPQHKLCLPSSPCR